MSVPKRTTTWVCVVCTLVLLAWPDTADAQRRRVRRRQGRPVLYTRVWYGPGYYNPYFYGPYSYGPWGPYPYYGVRYQERGSVRLEVKPEETEVYVDGYYAGVVDSYDGIFQRLHLRPGPHDIELRLEGHQSFQEQLYLPVGSTYHIRHQMEPLPPGESTPPPPVPPAQLEFEAEPSPRPEPGRRRAAPPERPPASDFGTLAIRVQPDDAVILVDGEEWRSPGIARLELDLGAGRHRIEVRRDGYEGYVTDVEVRPGETTAVNISLPQLSPPQRE